MPRIQTFVSNDVEIKLNDIVSIKRTEGASREEANISNTTAMIIELGIRVYELQRERAEGGFSQIEFNKVMLENMMKTSAISQKMIKILSKTSEVQGLDEFSIKAMSPQIKAVVDATMEQFFPSIDGSDN